jgi:hypothetical protein
MAARVLLMTDPFFRAGCHNHAIAKSAELNLDESRGTVTMHDHGERSSVRTSSHTSPASARPASRL